MSPTTLLQLPERPLFTIISLIPPSSILNFASSSKHALHSCLCAVKHYMQTQPRQITIMQNPNGQFFGLVRFMNDATDSWMYRYCHARRIDNRFRRPEGMFGNMVRAAMRHVEPDSLSTRVFRKAQFVYIVGAKLREKTNLRKLVVPRDLMSDPDFQRQVLLARHARGPGGAFEVVVQESHNWWIVDSGV